MIWAARERRRQGLHLQLRGAEGGQRRLPGALRLVPADLHRRRTAEGRRRAARPIRRKSRKRCSRALLLAASNAGDLVLDPVLRLRHDRRRRASGSAATSRHRARRRLTPPRRRRASTRSSRSPHEAVATAPTKRSEPRVAFASLVEAGLVAPGETLFDAQRRHRALVRADGALTLGPARRLDPQDRRAGAGPAGLQRLDLLARRARRQAGQHRRFPHRDSRRDARGGGIAPPNLRQSARRL